MHTEEKLICLVKEHECLYDIHSRYYNDKISKQQAWERISREMGITAEECTVKWKRLRDNYRKGYKSRKMKSGTAGSKERPLKHAKELKFLKAFIHKRPQTTQTRSLRSPKSTESFENTQDSDTTGNSLIESQDYDNNWPLLVSTAHGSQSLESQSLNAMAPETSVSDVVKQYLKAKSIAEKDPIDLFFSSMAANVKKLPQRLQVEVKRNVFNVVNDAEIMWLNESTSNDYKH